MPNENMSKVLITVWTKLPGKLIYFLYFSVHVRSEIKATLRQAACRPRAQMLFYIYHLNTEVYNEDTEGLKL